MFNEKRKPDYLLTAFIIAELLFVIIVIAIVANLAKSDNITADYTAQPSASVDGLSTIITKEEATAVEHSLYDLMLQNTEEKTLLDSNAVATIDADSEKAYRFESQGVVLLSAILNAPNLNQSYRLFFGIPDVDNTSFQQFYEILCIEAPVKPCASSSGTSELDIARSFLPYYEFDDITAYFSQDDPQKIMINPVAPFDGDLSTEIAYINEVQSAIRDLGLSPNAFTYYVLKPEDLTYINTD